MSSEVISKRYVKALMSGLKLQEAEGLSANLTVISEAFKNSKFVNILLMPELDNSKKEELILSFLEKRDAKIENLLKVLFANGRVDAIPAIAKEFNYQISIQKNEFSGYVISNESVDAAIISDIEKSLSKKIGSTIKLESKIGTYPGVKVEVDDLGIEVSFSTERLRNQMVEHILKAV
jgi:F-type H+-transporting ATPase subunit delta